MEKHDQLERLYDEDQWEFVCSGNAPSLPAIDEAKRAASPELYRLADVAATAPILTNDFRLMCENSRVIDEKPRSIALPPFRSKLNILPYNLDPHKNFPRNLFQLLQDAEERILDHIVCWQDRGRSFIVKEHEAFEKVVLFKCCKGTNATYQSFLATILSYGFVEIRVGKRKGGHRHNLFQRGKPKRLDELIREGTNNLLVHGNANEDDAIEMSRVQQPMAASDKPYQNIFVKNLYQLLRKSHSLGLDDAIHWEKSGKSFKVHKLNEKFSTNVLKDYLSMTRYRRFKEELMDRGFKCKEGKKYGIFQHPKFIRGQRGVSNTFGDIHLQRRKISVVNKQGTVSSSDSNRQSIDTKSPTIRRRKPGTAQKSAKSSDSNRQSIDTKSPTIRRRKPGTAQKSAKSSDSNRQSIDTKSPTIRRRKPGTAQKSAKSVESKPQGPSTRKRKAATEHKAASSNGLRHRKKECLVSNGTKEQFDIGEDFVTTTSRPKYNLSYKFRVPKAMYKILEECAEEGLSETIRWLPEGKSFFVNKELFTKFLHRRTKTKGYLTFEARMKSLGFEITDCSEGGSIFKHEHFVMGQNDKFATYLEAEALFSIPRKRPAKVCSQQHKHPKKTKVTNIQAKKEQTNHPKPSLSDVIQTNSSSPGSTNLLNSPEKENSHLRFDKAKSETDDQNSMGNHSAKLSPKTIGSPGLPAEKQSLPLSPVETPKAKESAKNFQNIILSTTNAITKAVASRSPSLRGGHPKKSSIGPKARSMQEGPANSKKRKITPSAPNKSTLEGKKDVATTDSSASSKVCGTNTMDSTKARPVSKCKIQAKVSCNEDP